MRRYCHHGNQARRPTKAPASTAQGHSESNKNKSGSLLKEARGSWWLTSRREFHQSGEWKASCDGLKIKMKLRVVHL